MKARILCIFLVAVTYLVSTTAAAVEDASIAPTASMNEQVVFVPGDPQDPAMLQVTILKPDGLGPFPLVVMNHGATGKTKRELQPRYRYSFSSYYFLSRGYAVALPMMRGFAGSEGKQNLNGCNQEEVGIANARDILSVMNYMLSQTFIDKEHVLVAGQSFGGWNTLAFGTYNDSRVKGLINFAGGAEISNCPSTAKTLSTAAKHFGAKTSIPSLWFYGDNDSNFASSIWHQMYDRYTEAGGPAELVAYGTFIGDAHNLLGFPEGLSIWAPRVDSFLSQIGLPNSIVHPEYLPVAFPEPTNFADLSDVNAVPYLNDKGKEAYRKYLSEPYPRVFVVSMNGTAGSFNGGFDPIGRAMLACQKVKQNCRVYSADNFVAWKRPTSAPRPTNFASLNNTDAVPYLKAEDRQSYEKYLTLRNPKAFAISPDGAWFLSSLAEDPIASTLGTCQKSHKDCRLYAVDDFVVWTDDNKSHVALEPAH